MSIFTQYDLFSQRRIVSGGNTMATTPIYVELDVSEDLLDLTGVEELTLITLTEGISAQFRWNVCLMSGYTRNTEIGTPSPLGTVISANGSLRQAAYTTLTNFMPTCRLMLSYGNGSGALQETALCSAMLCVKRIG